MKVSHELFNFCHCFTYCGNGVMQSRDLKGQEQKSFFETDGILFIPMY